MNEKLTALLEKLSVKLGTTTEYLWKVLIMQAKISALQSLFYILSVVIIGIVLFRLHVRFSKVIKDNRYNNNTYEDSDYIGGIMGIVAGIWLVMTICTFCFSISNMIDGFFNPEYWALNEILSKI
jgi:hypothetical protein